MSPKQGAKKLQQLPQQLERAAMTALNMTARKGAAMGRQMSSGRYNKARRERQGFSYARRAPNLPPPGDPAIINVESGDFRSAWDIEPAQKRVSGIIQAAIINNDDAAHFLTEQGTRFAIGRPIERKLRREIAPVLRQNLEAAMSKELR